MLSKMVWIEKEERMCLTDIEPVEKYKHRKRAWKLFKVPRGGGRFELCARFAPINLRPKDYRIYYPGRFYYAHCTEPNMHRTELTTDPGFHSFLKPQDRAEHVPRSFRLLTYVGWGFFVFQLPVRIERPVAVGKDLSNELVIVSEYISISEHAYQRVIWEWDKICMFMGGGK